ncbi:MAG: dTMP kinase [Candidatus Cloacimonetes bacterium]|nr:dTMP kinase [Candidatus Cloacimonadota bacterium]
MNLFITFEGPDGGGRSAQAELLGERLRAEGINFILTREPGGNGVEIAEQIRKILLTRDNQKMVAKTEALLYFAARAQHVRELIQPSLAQGITVVCERFNDSTLAYQGYGRGLDLQLLRDIAAFVANGLVPDVTFLLDIAPEIGLARKDRHALDRLEKEDLTFHQRVRQGYKILACGNPRFVVIDAEQSIEVIAGIVWGKVKQLLDRKE